MRRKTPDRGWLRRVASGAAALLCAGLVQAVPQPATAAPTRYEAENATYTTGSTVDSNYAGYSGTGFVNTPNAVGSYLEFTVNAATAGSATLAVRYANGTTADRPADLAVNGKVVKAGYSFPSTSTWSAWTTTTTTVPVTAGTNRIRLTATTAGGLANTDYADVEVTAAAKDYQAEDATLSQGTVATNHTGYTGTGFVDYTNVSGSSVEFTVIPAAAGGGSLAFRYANGTTADRPMDISVNGTVVASNVSFPPTANWDTWATKTVDAQLTAGSDKIRATAVTAGGGPNLDK